MGSHFMQSKSNSYKDNFSTPQPSISLTSFLYLFSALVFHFHYISLPVLLEHAKCIPVLLPLPLLLPRTLFFSRYSHNWLPLHLNFWGVSYYKLSVALPWSSCLKLQHSPTLAFLILPFNCSILPQHLSLSKKKKCLICVFITIIVYYSSFPSRM